MSRPPARDATGPRGRRKRVEPVIGAALKVAGARSFAAARWTIPYSYTASPAANKGVVMPRPAAFRHGF